MSESRKAFHQSDLSAFQQAPARARDWPDEAFWEWCESKYLPLLKGVPPTLPILELGCGSGLLLEFLQRQGYSRAQGIAASKEPIERAKARQLNAEVADAFEFLASKENFYGAIMAIDYIERFAIEELLRLIPAIYRALKEGGVLILQTPNGQGLFSPPVVSGDLTHLTILNPVSLGQLLRPAGFQEIQCSETGPVAKNFQGAVRMVLWKIVKVAANVVRIIETGKGQDIWTAQIICRCRKPYA